MSVLLNLALSSVQRSKIYNKVVYLAVGIWLWQWGWSEETWLQALANIHCQCVHDLHIFI